jgi:hypothetical protein
MDFVAEQLGALVASTAMEQRVRKRNIRAEG